MHGPTPKPNPLNYAHMSPLPEFSRPRQRWQSCSCHWRVTSRPSGSHVLAWQASSAEATPPNNMPGNTWYFIPAQFLLQNFFSLSPFPPILST